MKINGLNYSSYSIDEAHDVSYLFDAIQQHGDRLIYIGNDIELRFVVSGQSVTVRLEFGFEWDGASIPGFAQWLIGKPMDFEFRIASLLHDAGYEYRTRRVLHDVIFYYLLRQASVPAWKASIMFAAVRLGGHVYYASETSRFWRGVKWVLERT
ncbi:MAG: hypothetical protein CMI09_09255 [Oceanospirillaceae bacterium]|nr:hypothetical protein [Oceanospirillaceae bacterium]